MAIYIDDAYIPMDYYGMPLPVCHMTSVPFDQEELVVFAKSIGMKAKWLQKDNPKHIHFDVAPSKIKLALEKGATQIPWREYIELTRSKL
jgi:hypothetical protein